MEYELFMAVREHYKHSARTLLAAQIMLDAQALPEGDRKTVLDSLGRVMPELTNGDIV